MTTAEVTELDQESCHQLLRAGHIGRLALNDPQGPYVVPINYRFGDAGVVLRTSAGTKLEAARPGSAASFQIDAADQDRRVGWSVLVRGILEEVEDPAEAKRLGVDVEPLAGGERPHVVVLKPLSTTGRRISLERGHAAADSNVWFRQDGDDLLG